MWLEHLSGTLTTEVSRCLYANDEVTACAALQRVCVALTGRNSTAQEQGALRRGRPGTLMALLQGYIQEHQALMDPHATSITPPCGVLLDGDADQARGARHTPSARHPVWATAAD